MTPLFPRLTRWLAFAVLVGAPLVVRAKEAAPSARIATQATAEEYAAALIEETNSMRREHGVGPLIASTRLDAAADDQAAYMALRLKIDHHSEMPGQEVALDRVKRHGIEPMRVGENVAAVSIGKGDQVMTVQQVAQSLVAAWMRSPGHRATLLDRRLTHFGGAVRIARGLKNDWHAFGVQVFAELPQGKEHLKR